MNRYLITTEAGRLRGAIGTFYTIARYIHADTPEEAIEEFRRDIESNAPPKVELANMKPMLKPKTTYKDRDGGTVSIAGLCKYEVEGEEVFWSIQGNHYTASGLFVCLRRKPGSAREAMDTERYTSPTNGRNIASEDMTEAHRKWWDGVEV